MKKKLSVLMLIAWLPYLSAYWAKVLSSEKYGTAF